MEIPIFQKKKKMFHSNGHLNSSKMSKVNSNCRWELAPPSINQNESSYCWQISMQTIPREYMFGTKCRDYQISDWQPFVCTKTKCISTKFAKWISQARLLSSEIHLDAFRFWLSRWPYNVFIFLRDKHQDTTSGLMDKMGVSHFTSAQYLWIGFSFAYHIMHGFFFSFYSESVRKIGIKNLPFFRDEPPGLIVFWRLSWFQCPSKCSVSSLFRHWFWLGLCAHRSNRYRRISIAASMISLRSLLVCVANNHFVRSIPLPCKMPPNRFPTELVFLPPLHRQSMVCGRVLDSSKY